MVVFKFIAKGCGLNLSPYQGVIEFRTFPKRNLAVISFVFAMLFPSLAVSQTWEQLGPDGYSFCGTMTNPADADVVTVITNYPSQAAAWGSTDGGQTWTKKETLPGFFIEDVWAYDDTQIYAVGSSALYVSTDGGVTWATKSIPSSMGSAYEVCVHPNDPNRIYVASSRYNGGLHHQYVLESTNGGTAWVQTLLMSGSYAYPCDITISKSDPDILYVCIYGEISGGYGSFVYRSEDGGTQFVDITSVVEPTPLNNEMYCVVVDPTNENKVYIGGKAVYKSVDSGATWLKDASQAFDMNVMAVDPVNPANLYGVSETQIFASNDSAMSWNAQSGVIASDPSHVHVASATPSTAFISTANGGLIKTTDSGVTWEPVHSGISSIKINSIASAPSKPETLIVDASSSRLAASHDKGENWVDIVYPEGCSGSVAQILINSKDPNRIIALESG